jgi:predicted outer membrane repeat protein
MENKNCALNCILKIFSVYRHGVINSIKKVATAFLASVLLLFLSSFSWALDWNVYVNAYKNIGNGGTLLLSENITAGIGGQNSFSTAWPTNNHFTVNGNSKIIDSAGIVNMGFYQGLYNHTAGLVITYKDITFSNFKAINQVGNKSPSGGVFDMSYGEIITFTSQISFINNYATSGGVLNNWIAHNINEIASTYNFTNASVNFKGNEAYSSGGVFTFDNINGLKTVWTNLHFTNSVVNFIENLAGRYGGAIEAFGNLIISIENSSVSFVSNTAGEEGGAIYLYGSKETYGYSIFTIKNSTIAFINNLAAGVKNDIAFNTAVVSSIIFSNNVNLSNGIRISGGTSVIIRKIGEGKIIFSGDDTIMDNTFNLQVGTAVFNASKSTVSALNMSNNTSLSLSQDPSQVQSFGKLFINNPFTLNSSLSLDFDLGNKTSDYLSINGALTINTTQLKINDLTNHASFIVDGTSLAFIGASQITNYQNLKFADNNYQIVLSENKLWLVFIGWDSFVTKYKGGSDITLGSNIIAANSNSLAFTGDNITRVSIEGANNTINSNLIANLGFVYDPTSGYLEIKDTTFTGFRRDNNSQGGNGGVFNIFGNGALHFEGNLNFTNNVASGNGGVIYLNTVGINTRLSFRDAVVTFTNNYMNTDIKNDIYIQNTDNYLALFGDVFFTNGLRTAGAGYVVKVGLGQAVFVGETVINNKFSLESEYGSGLGSAVFRSAQSTVAAMDITDKMTLSLISNSTNTLFINGDFNLTDGYLVLDFSFGDTAESWIGDFISVKGNLTIGISTLTVNFINGGYAQGASEIAFLKAASIINWNKIYLSVNRDNYSISQADNTLYLTYNGTNSWEDFVSQYKAEGNSILLTEDITALAGSTAFESPGLYKSIVDGGKNTINSNGAQNKHFVLLETSMTFKDINMINFIYPGEQAQLSGGAIEITLSTITFRGTLNFINNRNNRSGGGSIMVTDSSVTFVNAIVNFTSNTTQNNGGAIIAMSENSSDLNFIVINSTISFINNTAKYGGALYIFYDTVIFRNSSITFINNEANNVKNDISLQGAYLRFDENINLPNGLRIDGSGFVRKTGVGKIIFSGEDTKIASTFDIQAGSAVFQANQSTITTLNMTADTTLSLLNNSTNTLFINTSNINGYIALDFDFNKLSSDFIFTNETLTIAQNSSLQANFISLATVIGSSIQFMQASNIINPSNLLPLITDLRYWIKAQDNGLWLVYGDTWNEFVYKYQTPTSIINLTQDISADDISIAFGNASNNFTVDGGNFKVNSNKKENYGFLLNGTSVSFRDISFTTFSASNGAVFNLSNNGKINFFGVVNFTNNKATDDGGAIYAAGSSIISFINSTVFFEDNLSNSDVANDIYLYDTGSQLIFDGDANIANGIHTGGEGKVRKTGFGQAVFGGDETIIKNTFAIEAGTVVFWSQKSTISALTMTPQTTLSLLNNSANTLFIDEDFILTGFLILDFDFESLTSDFISLSGNLTVQKSTLTINFINIARDTGVSIKFLQANGISDFPNLWVNTTLSNYQIQLSNNALWLYYGGEAPYWDIFVETYQASTGTISLDRDIVANDYSLGFNSPTSELIIDGKFKTINSNAVANLGFWLETKNITFKDISFTNFRGNQGAVLDITNYSTVTFNGIINFTNNIANENGGAIFADTNSIIIFKNSTATFRNNVVGDNPNDIYMEQSTLMEIINSNVKFQGGIAGAGKIEKTGLGILDIAKLQAQVLQVSDGQTIIRGDIDLDILQVDEGANFKVEGSASAGGGGINLMGNNEIVNDTSITITTATIFGTLGISLYGQQSPMIIVGEIFTNENSQLDIDFTNASAEGFEVSVLQIQTSTAGYQGFNLIPSARTYQIDFFKNDASGFYELKIILPAAPNPPPPPYDPQKEKALEKLNATFLTQSLIMTSKDTNANALYLKLRKVSVTIAQADSVRHPQSHAKPRTISLLTTSAWSEVSASQLDLSPQLNPLGNIKNTGLNLRAGTLIAARKDASVGIFVSASNNLIKQETFNTATVNSFEGGFYGGLFMKRFEYKAHLSFGKHDFSLRQNIVDDYKTQSEFSATSVKFGAQASFISKLFKQFDFKPYGGFRGTLLSNDEINENISETADFKIKAQTYKSLTGFAGIKIQNDNHDLSYYAKAELGYLMTGNNQDSQYDLTFSNEQTNETVRIRALEINPLSFSFSAGIEKPVSNNVNIYADIGYEKGENISFMQANVGVKIMFKASPQIKKYQALQNKEKQTLAKQKSQTKQKALELARQKKQKAHELSRAKEMKKQEAKQAAKQKALELERKQKQEAKTRRLRAKQTFRLMAASFPSNNSQLSAQAKANIANIAKQIKSTKYNLITAEGHSDNVGSDERNVKLSQARAKSVAQELLKNGIPKEKIKYIGLGSKIPLAPNSTPHRKPKNRRAEIFVE